VTEEEFYKEISNYIVEPGRVKSKANRILQPIVYINSQEFSPIEISILWDTILPSAMNNILELSAQAMNFSEQYQTLRASLIDILSEEEILKEISYFRDSSIFELEIHLQTIIENLKKNLPRYKRDLIIKLIEEEGAEYLDAINSSSQLAIDSFSSFLTKNNYNCDTEVFRESLENINECEREHISKIINSHKVKSVFSFQTYSDELEGTHLFFDEQRENLVSKQQDICEEFYIILEDSRYLSSSISEGDIARNNTNNVGYDPAGLTSEIIYYGSS